MIGLNKYSFLVFLFSGSCVSNSSQQSYAESENRGVDSSSKREISSYYDKIGSRLRRSIGESDFDDRKDFDLYVLYVDIGSNRENLVISAKKKNGIFYSNYKKFSDSSSNNLLLLFSQIDKNISVNYVNTYREHNISVQIHLEQEIGRINLEQISGTSIDPKSSIGGLFIYDKNMGDVSIQQPDKSIDAYNVVQFLKANFR